MVCGTFLAHWSAYWPFDQVVHSSEALHRFLSNFFNLFDQLNVLLLFLLIEHFHLLIYLQPIIYLCVRETRGILHDTILLRFLGCFVYVQLVFHKLSFNFNYLLFLK